MKLQDEFKKFLLDSKDNGGAGYEEVPNHTGTLVVCKNPRSGMTYFLNADGELFYAANGKYSSSKLVPSHAFIWQDFYTWKIKNKEKSK